MEGLDAFNWLFVDEICLYFCSPVFSKPSTMSMYFLIKINTFIY